MRASTSPPIFRVASLLAVLLAAPTACGGARDEAIAPSPPSPLSALEVDAARQRLFTRLSQTDRRLADRLGAQTSLVAQGASAADLARLFDFELRAHVLGDERARLARTAGGARSPELHALSELLGEELARLEGERDLPRGASAIVRSVVFDLHLTDSADASLDEALAATVDRLAKSIKDGSLGPMQLAELDDALDLLEKRTSHHSVTPAALARLRIALSQVRPLPREAIVPWSITERHLAAFLGPVPPDLDRALAAAKTALEPRLEKVLPKDPGQRARLVSEATSVLLATGDCPEPRLRELRAPVERRGLCHLLMSARNDDAVALLALDLAVDVGRWALRIHKGREDVPSVFSSLGTRVPLDESDGAHSFRFALAHPVPAVALGWGAALIAVDPRPRAELWLGGGAIRPSEADALLRRSLM